MTESERYQNQASAYARDLRSLIVSAKSTGPATRSAGATIEEVANVSERLPVVLEHAATLTSTVMDSGSSDEQEAAELRLLAQSAAEIRLANHLLQAAHDAKEGNAVELTTRAGGGMNDAIEEIAALLESPLGAEFAQVRTRAVQDRPQEFDAAKTDLKAEADRSLRSISKQAASVSAKAVEALLAFDPKILKKGLAGFSTDAAELVDKVVSAVSKFVRRIVEVAMRLLLQAHEWILKILGKDLEGKARKQIEKWVDDWVKDGDQKTIAQRLIEGVFSVATVRTDADRWLNQTKAPVGQINQAAESIQGLADRYKTKAEQVEKFLKGIGLIKLVPIAQMPQIQMVVAAVVACLLGYTVYTGYDHVDSGRVAFLERFGVQIPDRVRGIRATLESSL